MKKVTLPAEIEILPALLEFVADCAGSHGFSERGLLEVTLALEEIFVNICTYAFPDKKGDVEVECAYSHDTERLLIEVVDTGIPFDIFSAPTPDLTSGIDGRNVGGMGIPIVRNLVDKIFYTRAGERNILRLDIEVR